MQSLASFFGGCALSFLFAGTSLAATPLRMVEGDDGVAGCAKGILRLLLTKMDERYVREDKHETSAEARIVETLRSEQLDIVWYWTSHEYEEIILPVRIPIYCGLLGYRMVMIKRGNQDKFAGVRDIEDLKRISIGQGRF